MKTLDLRATKEATDPAREAPAQLVPRVRMADVRYRDRTATVSLTAPGGEQRTHIDRMAATLAGVPWAQLNPRAGARFHGLALFAVCVGDAPDWLVEAAQEDDDLLFAFVGALEAHAARYFHGDAGTGGAGEEVPRVVVVLADT